MSSQSKITWAVEFEFAAPDGIADDLLVSSTDPSSLPSEKTIFAIASYLKKLTKLPVAMSCNCSDSRTAHACQSLKKQDHLLHRLAVLRRPLQPYPFYALMEARVFHVKNDFVVPPGATGWTGVEISTPARFEDELRAGGGAEMKEIKELITTLAGWEDAGFCVTDKCGLHMHIGVQSEQGITLEIAKRTFTLIALLEENLLIRLVEAHRTSAHFFKPLTHQSVASRWASEHSGDLSPDLSDILHPGHEEGAFWAVDGPKMGAFLHKLWQASDLEALSVDMSVLRGIDRSLAALCIRYDDPSQPQYQSSQGSETINPRASTFELRYPEMSFDPIFIQKWVKLAARIVSLARDNQRDEYKTALHDIFQALNKVQTADTIVPDLLKALNFTTGEINEWLALVPARGKRQDPSLRRGKEWRMLRTPFDSDEEMMDVEDSNDS